MSFVEDFKPRPGAAYLLIAMTTIIWAGSTVLSRAVHLEVPPFGLSFWRWSLAALVLLPLAWPELKRKRDLIRANFKLLCLMGLLQVGSSAVLVLGLNFTTAVNGSLINASQPALTALPAWLIAKDKLTWGQGVGIFAAMTGVTVMITRGDPSALLELRFNQGDLLVLMAIGGWACYAPLIHRIPGELGLATTLFFITLTGSAMLIPFYVVESLFFRTVELSSTTLLSVLYLGLVVSAFSVLIWNAGIKSIGPNRAVILLNLIPVFGVLMAIGFLGESLFAYHLVGVAFVACGIGLVIFLGRRGNRK